MKVVSSFRAFAIFRKKFFLLNLGPLAYLRTFKLLHLRILLSSACARSATY